MNSSRAGSGSTPTWAEPLQVDSVGERDGASFGDEPAVFLGHRDDAVDGFPGGDFESAPAVELPPQLPIVVEAEQLLVEVEGDVVLDQDRRRGGAIRGVLRHLGELELREDGTPLSDGLAQRGVKG